MTALIHAEREYHGDPHVGYSFAKFSGPVSGIKKVTLIGLLMAKMTYKNLTSRSGERNSHT
jgi:hypothetical protein